jgi:hypothetical protein
MTDDPILDELHKTRRRLLAESGGTLERLAADLQKRQRESGRTILKTQRTTDCTEGADSAVTDGTSSPAAR